MADDTAIYIKFFFVVLGVSIFFMTGPNEPLGTIKAKVMEESGLFAPFRSVYQRFGEYAALAYAPLIGAGLQTLTSFLRHGWPRRMDVILGKSAGVALAGVLATMLALPMWTGSLFDSSGVIPSRRVTIPPEYSTVAQWIDAQPGDFNVLPFPNGPTPLTALSWSRGEDGYLGNEPLQLLTGKPFLSGDPSAPYLADLIAQASTGGTRAWPALRFLNVRYIVVHLDADRAYLQGLNGWVGIDTNQVASTFDTTPGLRLALVAGGLRVYEVTRWKPFELFAAQYVPSLSVYALPLDEVRPIHYGFIGSGRYFVPPGQLTPGEVLVVNHPYDPLWRAEGDPPFRLNPGLTAFRVEGSGSLVVTHQLEARFPLLLALAPTIVAALAIVAFLWTRRSRREVSG